MRHYILLFCFLFINNVYSQKPQTVPALREWEDFDSKLQFNNTFEIHINHKDFPKLESVFQTFNEDLFYIKNYDLNLNISDVKKSNIIYCELNEVRDTLFNDEGYTIQIDSLITLRANSDKGIFYATRSLIQLIKQSDVLQCGYAIDYPDYPERAFMMDLGRKYCTMDWVKNHIRELSYLKLNTFHLHLSENIGFRLESELYPEIVSEQFYSKDEIRELIELSKKYYVDLIPEIDMPGHMGAILKSHPELILKNNDGIIVNPFMDITLDTVRNFVKNLILEYIELFPSKYWHLGADEYLYDSFEKFPQFEEYAKNKINSKALSTDVFFEFINWVNTIVKSKGRTLRIWNDGITKLETDSNFVKVDKDIVVDFWLGPGKFQKILDGGYKVSNCNIDFLYYILGNNWSGYMPGHYEFLGPANFNYYNAPPKLPQVLGYKFHVWCDTPDYETEGHIANEIKNTLRVISQKSWGSELLTPKYIDFLPIVDTIGLAPGVKFPDNPIPGNLLFKKQPFVLNEDDAEFDVIQFNDGSYNTFQHFDSLAKFELIYNLEKQYTINQIKSVWFREHSNYFAIYSSSDSIDWTLEFDKFSDISKYGGRLHIIDTFNFVAKYLKFTISEKSINAHTFGLCELLAFGEEYINDVSVDLHQENAINIFPNPTNHDILFINFNQPIYGDIKVMLYDYLGKLILEKDFNSISNDQIVFDIKEFGIGIYNVILYDDGNLIGYRKVLKIK